MALSVNLVDGITPALRAVHALFARPASYVRQGAAAQTIAAYVRGIRADDLFGAALQQDVAGVINAEEFRTLFGAGTVPQKFDRLRTMGKSYSVEEWRGSPNDDAPVFFKLLLRGGSQ